MPALSYGFQITTEPFARRDEVFVRVFTREPDAKHPINPRSDGESEIWDAPKRCHGLLLSNLRLRTHTFLERRPPLTALIIEYGEICYLDLAKAKKAAKTLERIRNQIARDNAEEAGDTLISFAKAIHATFLVTETSARPNSHWLPDGIWRFDPVTAARDEFRRRIAANIENHIPGTAAA